MKKAFKFLWKDILWDIFCFRLPLLLTFIFSFIVFNFWDGYELIKIITFFITSNIICDIFFNKIIK